MKSPEGIQEFIEYKKSVEKERPLLTIEPRLITIDGVDGIGKSTIAKKFVEKLRKRFGEDKVVLVDITNFRGSPKQEKLGAIAKQENINDLRLDALYAAGVNRAYEEVIIPALEQDKIVVADRSEIDLLRYALEYSDKESIEKRKKYIQDGTITHRLWAGNRIFLESNPEDAWENLKYREHNSRYDPTSLEEVEANINAQHEAEKQIESLPYQGEMRIIREKVARIEDASKREEYFDELIEKLSSSISLSEAENGDE